MIIPRKQKGLLIFTLGFVLFLGALEISLLSMIEITMSRVVQMKRRETAKNLSEMSETYSGILSEKMGENYFPALRQKGAAVLIIEGEGKNTYRYEYNSPALFRNGYFTLTGYYRNNRIEKITGTGHFEGTTHTRQINLK